MKPYELSLWQRCKRLPQLTQTYQPVRLPPKRVFDTIFQEAVRSGVPVLEAGTRFLEVAANPGLDTLADPYTLAQDYCYALQTALHKARQLPAGGLVKWSVERSPNRNRLSQIVHSWETVVPMAQNPLQPMTLNLLYIGQESGSHLLSPWCRVFKHPVIANQHKFQNYSRENGPEPLGGNWTPVWLQDLPKQTVEGWVEMMDRDNVNLIQTVTLRGLEPGECETILRQAEAINAEIDRADLADWLDLPMSRGACDFPTPCPYQTACYGGSCSGLVEITPC